MYNINGKIKTKQAARWQMQQKMTLCMLFRAARAKDVQLPRYVCTEKNLIN